MLDWYRGELRTLMNELLCKWQEKIGVRPGSWGIKRIKILGAGSDQANYSKC